MYQRVCLLNRFTVHLIGRNIDEACRKMPVKDRNRVRRCWSYIGSERIWLTWIGLRTYAGHSQKATRLLLRKGHDFPGKPPGHAYDIEERWDRYAVPKIAM